VLNRRLELEQALANLLGRSAIGRECIESQQIEMDANGGERVVEFRQESGPGQFASGLGLRSGWRAGCQLHEQSL